VKEYHATYIGPRRDLQGETALVHVEEFSPTLTAQFDRLTLGLKNGYLCFGWHPFPAEHFRLDRGTDAEGDGA